MRFISLSCHTQYVSSIYYYYVDMHTYTYSHTDTHTHRHFYTNRTAESVSGVVRNLIPLLTHLAKMGTPKQTKHALHCISIMCRNRETILSQVFEVRLAALQVLVSHCFMVFVCFVWTLLLQFLIVVPLSVPLVCPT